MRKDDGILGRADIAAINGDKRNEIMCLEYDALTQVIPALALIANYCSGVVE